jgi:hypothetical protein
MAFDYQTLKNLSSASFVANTLTGSDIGSSQITTALIANTSLTATELATSAVDMSTGTVTGTLGLSKGGTGNTGFGSAYQVMAGTGSATSFVPHGIRAMQVYTSTTTWTKPAGVRFVHVQVQGGGGGASGHGESGAAGGYAEKIIDVTGITSVGVTIGGGGGGTYYSGAGTDGGTSSFGPYVSAGGGYGANRNNQHNGGVSGSGSGGDLNLYQGSGGGHEQRSSGMGGSTFFGGPAPAGHPQGGHFSHNHQNHSAPGTGGTSGFFSGHRGSDGRPGIIIVTEWW